MNGRFGLSFPRLALLLSALYLAQGLPAGLIAHALPALMRDAGISASAIGLIKLLALPWLFKFIWAPYVDRGASYAARKRWIVAMQLASALALAALAFSFQAQGVWLFIPLILILVINTCAATQDIATDAIAVSSAPSDRLGWVNSIQVGGYKVGMIIGGSGLLVMSGMFGVPWLIAGLALILLFLLVPLLVTSFDQQPKSTVSQATGPQGGFAYIWQSYRGFFGQANMRFWILVLLSYKVADSLGSSMLKPMLIDQGWSLSDVGTLIFQASLIGLAGAFSAGLLHRLVGRAKALVWFAAVQVLTVSCFYLIANEMVSTLGVRLLVCAEQFADGLSTVALFAAMMSHCREGHEGGDYTVQASLQIVLAGVVGALSGFIVDASGYADLYLSCALAGIVSLLVVIAFVATKPEALVSESIKPTR